MEASCFQWKTRAKPAKKSSYNGRIAAVDRRGTNHTAGGSSGRVQLAAELLEVVSYNESTRREHRRKSSGSEGSNAWMGEIGEWTCKSEDKGR